MNEISSLQPLLDKAQNAMPFTKEEAVAFLLLPGDSDLDRALTQAADAATREVAKGRGRIWAAIGVDGKPCSRNCRFCSFGRAWKVFTDVFELSTEEVCERAAQLADQGADWITLRTTQDYGVKRLAALGRAVRKVIPDDVGLVANTGEFGEDDAKRFVNAGFTTVYHVHRLREGIDTGISPAERLRTLEVIKNSGLELGYLVEPVGPEHSVEELVTEALRAREFGATLVGAMARVPVPGTPLGSIGAVSEERLARVVTMTRLVAGRTAAAVCVHPPTLRALQSGANTVVVESAAIPRDTSRADNTWRAFSMNDAHQLLQRAGFTTRHSTACIAS